MEVNRDRAVMGRKLKFQPGYFAPLSTGYPQDYWIIYSDLLSDGYFQIFDWVDNDHHFSIGYLQDVNLTSSRDGFLRLTRLDLTDNWYLTDRGLSSIVEHCPLLMELILTRCYELRGRSVVVTISSCENLRSLKMNFCFFMDEKSLEWVGAMSRNLMYMDISHNVNITSMTLRNIKGIRISHGRAPLEIITSGCPRIAQAPSRFKYDDKHVGLVKVEI